MKRAAFYVDSVRSNSSLTTIECATRIVCYEYTSYWLPHFASMIFKTFSSINISTAQIGFLRSARRGVLDGSEERSSSMFECIYSSMSFHFPESLAESRKINQNTSSERLRREISFCRKASTASDSQMSLLTTCDFARCIDVKGCLDRKKEKD